MTDLILPSGSGQSGIDPDELTAAATDVLKGKIAGVNGSDEPVEGTLEVQSVINFNAAQYSSLTLLASWALPAKGPWSGLRVMCKQGEYPSSPQDGTLFYEGSAASATKALAAGTWYFRAWDYMATNYGRIYGGCHDKTGSNVQVKGQQVFTSSAYFTVPANVRQIQVFVVGGGGGGGAYRTRGYPYDAGGGGGGYTSTGTVNVQPGQQLYVSIGAGGINANGGTTSIAGVVSALGGYVGGPGYAGSGGSGGGSHDRGAGGSNGGNGGGSKPGSGQGRTTRAFGEASSTLYAGGGGGGYAPNGTILPPAAGGAGGGGNGGLAKEGGTIYDRTHATAGSFGTGGGGGGGCYNDDNEGIHSWAANNAGGGSGIAIIRWGY